jgi:hypothetical protein
MDKDDFPADGEIMPAGNSEQSVLRIGQWTISLTRKTRIVLSLVGLGALCAPGAFFLSEFNQTRGIVHLGYSRLWLFGLFVVGFLMFWLVTSQLIRKQWLAVLLSLLLPLIAVVGIDKWTPIPSPTEEPIVHIAPERDMLWSTKPGQTLGVFTLDLHNTGIPIDVVEIEKRYFLAQRSTSIILKRLPDLIDAHKGLLDHGSIFQLSLDFNPFVDDIGEVSANFREGPSLPGVYIVVRYRRPSDGKSFQTSRAYGALVVPYGASKLPKAVAVFAEKTNMDRPTPEPLSNQFLTLSEVVPYLALPERWISITKEISTDPNGKIRIRQY